MRNLNYRTIRYPGHAAIMKALLNDLRLRDRRDLLKDILEHAVPATLQDVVIVFVTVSGLKDGQLVQETYANKIYAREVGDRMLSAIQITTASSLCAVLDLLAEGAVAQKRLRAPGGDRSGGVPGQPLRSRLRRRRRPAVAPGACRMTVHAQPGIAAEAARLLDRLGVHPAPRRARRRTPITGEAIARSR